MTSELESLSTKCREKENRKASCGTQANREWLRHDPDHNTLKRVFEPSKTELEIIPLMKAAGC